MASSNEEIAGSIVQEVLKARGQAIAGIAHPATQNKLITEILNDETVVNLYKEIFKAVNNSYTDLK